MCSFSPMKQLGWINQALKGSMVARERNEKKKTHVISLYNLPIGLSPPNVFLSKLDVFLPWQEFLNETRDANKKTPRHPLVKSEPCEKKTSQPARWKTNVPPMCVCSGRVWPPEHLTCCLAQRFSWLKPEVLPPPAIPPFLSPFSFPLVSPLLFSSLSLCPSLLCLSPLTPSLPPSLPPLPHSFSPSLSSLSLLLLLTPSLYKTSSSFAFSPHSLSPIYLWPGGGLQGGGEGKGIRAWTAVVSYWSPVHVPPALSMSGTSIIGFIRLFIYPLTENLCMCLPQLTYSPSPSHSYTERYAICFWC